MPEAGDFVKTRVVNVVSGQQTQLAMFWQVAAILGVDTLVTAASDLAALYWDAVKGQIPASVEFQAFTWENQSRNEKLVVYPGLAGVGGSEPMAAYNVIRMNIWGRVLGPPDEVHRNAINVPGIRESNIDKGVLARGSYMNLLRNFLTQQQDTSPSGIQLNPQVRWRTVQGPPAEYAFTPVEQCQENPVATTLRSRRPGSF